MKEDYLMEKEIKELEEYANMEGTEIGELCHVLIRMANYRDYMSDEFRLALEKEIKSQLNMFKGSTQIVEKVETFTQKFKELEWL